MEHNRLGWVDTLKGIGILMVVAGHVWEGLPARIIYLCHMPLFFLLSGFLFRPRERARDLIQTKAWALLVPYAAFIVILYVPQSLMELAQAGFSMKAVASALLRGIIGGRSISGWAGIVWFVSCLFLTQIAVNALIARFSDRTIWGLMGVFLVLAYINGVLLQKYWLPWNANVVLMAAPFFWVGYKMRTSGFECLLWISFGGTAVAVGLVCANIGVEYDMKNAQYGVPVVSFFTALVAVCFLIEVSKSLDNLPALRKALAWLGASSMAIMYVHKAFIAAVRDGAGWHENWVVFGLAVFLSCAVSFAAQRSEVGRRYLLGIR